MRHLLTLVSVACCATGCATPHTKIGIPVCQEPEPVTPAIWNNLDKLRKSMSDRDLARLECIEKYKVRIEKHDESL